MTTQTRPFSFYRAGGVDQVRFERGADLVDLKHLDRRLWVALACPTRGLAVDPRTLAVVDADSDGRIRVDELSAAAAWAGAQLKDVEDLLKAPAALPLSAIADTTDEAKGLRLAALAMLTSLDKASATELSDDDVKKARAAFDQRTFNGDGIVTAEAAKADDAAALFKDVLAHEESVTDAGGKPGVNVERLDAFFKRIGEAAEWFKAGEAEGVHAAGEGTQAAHDAVEAVRARVDDYFARCRVAAFDERAAVILNRSEKDLEAFAAQALSLDTAEVKALPLSKVAAGRALHLRDGVNPTWASALEALSAKAVTPLVGEKPSLTEADWTALVAKLAPFRAWLSKRAGGSVGDLGKARVLVLAADGARAPLDALLAEEKKEEPAAKAMAGVEKLFLLRRDLLTLADNFAAFGDFYRRQKKATFIAGQLYLDQRLYELCLPVEDAGKHATLGALSGLYLAYCDCARPASGEKRTIVAAVTAGDDDSLMVGRNGIFYDRDGKDWDATITKLVVNPISIRQAFWSPYKKLLRFVEEQVAKRAAAADTEANARLKAGAQDVDRAAGGTEAAPAAPKKLDIGVVAAIGVAVGGISAVMGAFLQLFFGLGWWMPAGMVGLMLLISGPSMLIAWLKLRRRNLGPLLDANGWAINARARVTLPLGTSLTRLKALPPGSKLELADPFADKRRPWWLYLALLVLLVLGGAWYLGKVDKFLPPAARSVTVLGAAAPSAKPAPAPAAAEAPAPTPAAP